MAYSGLDYTLASGVISSLERRLLGASVIRHLAELRDEEEFYRSVTGTSSSLLYHSIVKDSEGGGARYFPDGKTRTAVAAFLEDLIVKYIPDEPLKNLFLGIRRLEDFRSQVKSQLSEFYNRGAGENFDFEKKFLMLPQPFGGISSKIFSLKKPPSPRKLDFIITSDFFEWALDISRDYPLAYDYVRLLIDSANAVMAFEKVNFPDVAVYTTSSSSGASGSQGENFLGGGFIDRSIFEREFIVKKSSATGGGASSVMATDSVGGTDVSYNKNENLISSLINVMKFYGRGYRIPSDTAEIPLSFISEEPSAAISRVLDDIRTEYWRNARLKEPFGFHLVAGYVDAVLTEIKNLQLILSGIAVSDSPDKIKLRLRRTYV